MTLVSSMSTAAKSASAVVLLLSGLVLTGCSPEGAIVDDVYVPASVDERYPIRVGEAPVKMNLNARGGSLRAEHVNGLIGFARDARNNARSRISVHYASGSAHARNVAQQAVSVLMEQGIPRGSISVASYSGSSAMVTLSFQRRVAITAECGDWSENLAGDRYNEPPPNFGCAVQQNTAAMVADPEDFEGPRPMSPVIGSTRSDAIRKYAGGGMVASTGPGTQSATESSTTSGDNAPKDAGESATGN